MIGEVDAACRALITLRIKSTTAAQFSKLVAWVDTAFDGELVLPQGEIQRLGLAQSGAVSATLADGTTAVLETYHCLVDWIGGEQQVEVVANEGRFPLLGIGLLRGRRLTIDYGARTLAIE